MPHQERNISAKTWRMWQIFWELNSLLTKSRVSLPPITDNRRACFQPPIQCLSNSSNWEWTQQSVSTANSSSTFLLSLLLPTAVRLITHIALGFSPLFPGHSCATSLNPNRKYDISASRSMVPKTSIISRPWSLLERQILTPIPDRLNQKLSEWDPAMLTSLPDDSDDC